MNLDALRMLSADPARAALLSDYDGSLSMIVDHPDDAIPFPGVVALLERLVAHFGRVGIVSGRPVEFLRRVLPVDGLELVGQYGLERWVDGGIVVDARVGAYTDAIASVADTADADLPGVFVERKGSAAVTLHWRMNPELGDGAVAWARQAAEHHGLTEFRTKMAVELRPPVAIDKGTGVTVLAAGFRTTLFAGDDHGDLSGFTALDQMRAATALDAVVRVAVRSAEEPAELIAAADVLVDGPAGLVDLLTQLVDAVSAHG